MITGKFGRYEIKSEIARGGMATVYHAYDPNFERNIAIKVLPQALLHDPQFRTRFEREAKVIARLEHPAIVPVYDFGEEDGQPYIIMRYMSGGSLTERIERGPMPLSETAEIIERLAPALDASHALDIIHRDIKPGNVLFDRYGNAYLSDFGIARIITDEQATSLSGEAILGTPAYMSPEQVQGNHNISGRTDIYALGVLIYQMLSGDRPFYADTPAQLMMKHIMEPVPDITKVRMDLPEAIDKLLSKAMAKEPEARFATVTEMASALKTISQGGAYPYPGDAPDRLVAPVHPERVKESAVTVLTPQTPVPAQPQSKRWLVIAGVLLALLVVVIGGFATVGSRGVGPLAGLAPGTNTLLPTWTNAPTATSPPTLAPTHPPNTPTAAAVFAPTATMEPSPIPTEIPSPTPAAPVIGGADKIGFLINNEIWAANLDGSELSQLTADGASKKGLGWSPDGDSIYYITGKCVKSISLDGTVEEQIACFNNAGELKSFQISPDGGQVAISLDNQLYIVPYEVDKLSSASKHADLRDMADCEHLAHYKPFFVKHAQWSRNAETIGTIIMGNSGDLIHVFAVDRCVESPDKLYTIPRSPLPEDYKNAPRIVNFGWDGSSLYSFNTYIRKMGFGNLYRYNMGLIQEGKIFSDMINPIQDKCCYRDSVYSPDGKYLLFTYQDQGDGTIRFYMVEDALLGTGINYQPLPLPELIAEDESTYPILRPAKTP